MTVEANALQVQADTSDISQTITSNQIENLATNGRNILQLRPWYPVRHPTCRISIFPERSSRTAASISTECGQDANNWIIDGGEAYDRGGGGILLVSPSQDALQEMTISTSNYAADLGNSSGGMISMAVKNGTKQFHGAAWEYIRNDALDAYSYLLKQVARSNKTGTPLQRVRIQHRRTGGV